MSTEEDEEAVAEKEGETLEIGQTASLCNCVNAKQLNGSKSKVIGTPILQHALACACKNTFCDFATSLLGYQVIHDEFTSISRFCLGVACRMIPSICHTASLRTI